ncbi:hCG1811732, isoform CRA_a [Homo sapiens]
MSGKKRTQAVCCVPTPIPISAPRTRALLRRLQPLHPRGEAEVSRKQCPTVAPQSVQCELRPFPQVWSFLIQLRPPSLYSLSASHPIFCHPTSIFDG